MIREERKGKKILAVMHKLKTVMDFDRIAVPEKGSLGGLMHLQSRWGDIVMSPKVCGIIRENEPQE
jgi:hypothetical protein